MTLPADKWQATANDGAKQGQKMNFTGIDAQQAQQRKAMSDMQAAGAVAGTQGGWYAAQQRKAMSDMQAASGPISGPIAGRPIGEVSNQIARIEGALQILEGMTREFIERLLPIIAQQADNQANGQSTPQDPPCSTGIGGSLRAIRERIETLQNIMQLSNGGLEL